MSRHGLRIPGCLSDNAMPMTSSRLTPRAGTTAGPRHAKRTICRTDRPDFFFAACLPLRFAGVMVDGVAQAGPVYLTGGSRVEQSTA